MHPYAGGYAYGAPHHNPYAQQQPHPHPHMQPYGVHHHPAAAFPHAAAAGPSAYPPAPTYYQQQHQQQQQQHVAYGAATIAPYAAAPMAAGVPVPGALSVLAAPVEEAPAAPLSPISAMRAREAAMVAFNLAQAALPPPPAAAVQPVVARPTGAAAASSATAAAAVEEEEVRDPNEIEMRLENAHYNLNEVLGANLIAHPYYRDLSKFTSVEEVVDEIYAEVKNVEPMVAGKDRLPSTAFFLLYKLFELRLTKRQMHALLRHKDSPYIRALGFLYLRCVVDPKALWGWFEPYLCDPAVFVPGQQDPAPKTMGAFVRELLEKNDYYSMKLRRIPVPVHRDYQLKLLSLDARTKRAERNEPYRARIVKGMRLQAEYYDDCKFYDAVVDRVEDGPGGKFIVTYIEYGQSEEIDIGALKLPPSITDAEPTSRERERGAPQDAPIVPHRSSSRDVSRESERRRDRGHSRERSRDRKRSRSRDRRRSRSRSRDRRHRHDRSRSRDRRRRSSRSPSSHARDVFSELPAGGGRSHHSSSAAMARARARSPSPEVSLEALRRKEREEAVAQGKDYARRPSSYKNSLSMSLISGTARRRSRTPPVRRDPSGAAPLAAIEEAPRKSGLSEEARAARAALLAKYGDAGSHREKAAQRNKSAADDDDVIRLGR